MTPRLLLSGAVLSIGAVYLCVYTCRHSSRRRRKRRLRDSVKAPIQSLPPELLALTFSFLPPAEVSTLAHISIQFKRATQDANLWQYFYSRTALSCLPRSDAVSVQCLVVSLSHVVFPHRLRLSRVFRLSRLFTSGLSDLLLCRFRSTSALLLELTCTGIDLLADYFLSRLVCKFVDLPTASAEPQPDGCFCISTFNNYRRKGTFQALAPLPDLGGVGLHYFEAEILEGAEGIAVGFAPSGCEGFDRLPGKHTNSCALHNGIGIVCGRRVVEETPLLVPGDVLGCGYDGELFFFTLNGAPLSNVVFHSANFLLDSIRASVGLYAAGVRLRLNLGHAPFVYSSELRLSILTIHT